ncbi:MAG: class I SAM-dependent rRNA methyltransferase [Bacteroidales bacterium]
MSYTQVILKSGKDQSLMRRHPWVFSGAIKKIKGPVEEGDIVEVTNNKDEFLGLGHYQIGSIAIRIISFTQTPIDEAFWKQKLQSVIEYRSNMDFFSRPQTNVFRLIHAEGDDLPGLIVDYYNGTLVMQMHSIGMYKIRKELAQLLQEMMPLPVKAIYDKSANTLPHKANIEPVDEYLIGKAEDTLVEENGLKFRINWEEGQKTGFFVDQRDSRSLVKHYAKKRTVLNMFGYTGGFSLYALAGEAKEVHSVDSSKLAIDLTNEHVNLNFPDCSNHFAYAEDAFSFLDKMDDSFDLIILDPPAFAKHHNVLHNALQGYKKLNRKALEKIKPGGILFTFSCSQVVSKENFRKSVFTAAANTGRKVRILHQLTQPVDHPVNIYHPESEYLKGLVVYVE